MGALVTKPDGDGEKDVLDTPVPLELLKKLVMVEETRVETTHVAISMQS